MKIFSPHTVSFSQASATQISKFTNQNHSYKIYGYHRIVDKHIMISDENLKQQRHFQCECIYVQTWQKKVHVHIIKKKGVWKFYRKAEKWNFSKKSPFLRLLSPPWNKKRGKE